MIYSICTVSSFKEDVCILTDISVFDIVLDSGKARGLSAYAIRNGAFECVIVKDHALDIAHASFCGTGVAFISRNGLLKGRDTFQKSFEGGLLYTCGLEPATTRFDTFKMTPIAARDTHEYNVNIKFKKI